MGTLLKHCFKSSRTPEPRSGLCLQLNVSTTESMLLMFHSSEIRASAKDLNYKCRNLVEMVP